MVYIDDFFDEIIHVTGTVIIESNKFHCPFMVAYVNDELLSHTTRTVVGDLVIDDEQASKISSYSLILAKNSIVSYVIGSKLTTPHECYWHFNNCIDSLNKLVLIENNSNDQKELLLRLIYLGVFSAYEGYIIRVLEVMFTYFPHKYFELYLNNKSAQIGDLQTGREKENKSLEYVRLEYANNFDRLNNKLLKIFGFVIPENYKYSFFDKYHIRNNIAHRNGMNLNGDKIIITKDDITNIIIQTQNLVDFISQKICDIEEKETLKYIKDYNR